LDLYGTLLVFGNLDLAWQDWLASLYADFRALGLQMSKDAFSGVCDGFFGVEEPSRTGMDLTVFERRLQAVLASAGLGPVNAAQLRSMADAAVDAWQRQISPDPEAASVLAKLHESKVLVLISNFDHPPHVHSLLERLGWREYFDAIVISGDVGVKKPDPSIFRIALDRTGLSPDEVVHVGDTTDDTLGATAAGLIPVLIRRPRSEGKQALLDYKASRDEGDGKTAVETTPEGMLVVPSLIALLQTFP
jgi:HAD superfamily hydrolase (TIGR01509 family)